MKRQINHFCMIFFGVSVLLFQNCTGGFHLGSDELTDSTAASSSGVLLYEQSLSELQPYSYKFSGSETVSFQDALPAGAFYDSDTRTLYWIPTKGQRGDYNLGVKEGGVDKFRIAFHVLALDDYKLRYGGPPFHYQDGDVGYIFVHGVQDTDLCIDRSKLEQYWGGTPQTIAPDSNDRSLACYDGRKAVAAVAESVAHQIMDAKCGFYKKCIIITHSMGGLLMEHMFLHIRPPVAIDPVQSWFDQRELYKAVREKTLFVISLASAAGGSKTADLVNGNAGTVSQDVIGALSRWMGANMDSTNNLMVAYASRVVAPMTEDPGVPFFMVPGFTTKTLYEARGFFGSIWDTLINSVPDTVFNGDGDLTFVDGVTEFPSRSDGVVDLRSSCGIASDDYNNGVGDKASLDDNLHYCWGAPKKANHYLWFAVNLNHSLITRPAAEVSECFSQENPCVPRFPASLGNLFPDDTMKSWAAIDVIRNKIAMPRMPAAPVISKGSLAGN
ncbi:MAG TPA: hypothetical protein VIG33_11620 [Pseudobdellovibrionaceae bacterium]